MFHNTVKKKKTEKKVGQENISFLVQLFKTY